MIAAYATDHGKLRQLADPIGECARALWIDVKAPTAEEEAALEKALGLDIPTREEMEEIEVSSRLYLENGAAYATALALLLGLAVATASATRVVTSVPATSGRMPKRGASNWGVQ